jgi:hypothetical protein
MRKWPCAWKINLIRTDNPDWLDLSVDWYAPDMTKAEIDQWLVRIAAIDDKALSA